MSAKSPYSADSYSDTSSIVGYPAIGQGGIRDVDIVRSRFLDVGMYCGIGIAPLSEPYNRASAASFDRQVDQEQSADHTREQLQWTSRSSKGGNSPDLGAKNETGMINAATEYVPSEAPPLCLVQPFQTIANNSQQLNCKAPKPHSPQPSPSPITGSSSPASKNLPSRSLKFRHKTPRHHRRFVRWVVKRFKAPWSTVHQHSTTESEKAVKRAAGQGFGSP